MSSQELENLITESITDEIFVIKRKIELLSKIINNFDSIDCDSPTAQSFEKVYCEKLRKFDLLELKHAKDSLSSKFENLIKQEFRKNRRVRK
jgi:hypothetical protein